MEDHRYERLFGLYLWRRDSYIDRKQKPPGYFYKISGWFFVLGGDNMQHTDYAGRDFKHKGDSENTR